MQNDPFIKWKERSGRIGLYIYVLRGKEGKHDI